MAEAEGEDVVARQLKAMKAEAMRARLMAWMILELKKVARETMLLLKRLENIPLQWFKQALDVEGAEEAVEGAEGEEESRE